MYDKLDGASAIPPSKSPLSKLPQSSSEDNIVDSLPPKPTTQSSPKMPRDTENSNQPDSFESKPTYAIPPRRRAAPRPPVNTRKVLRSATIDTISTPDKGI